MTSPATVISYTCDHITPVMQQLHWLLVWQRVEFQIAVLVYQALNDLAPRYLSDDCQLVTSRHHSPAPIIRQFCFNCTIITKSSRLVTMAIIGWYKYVRLRGRSYIHTCRSYAWPARWTNRPSASSRGELDRFQSAKVTFKAIQGHWQWCHYISRILFPISVSLQLCFYLAPLMINYFPKFKEATWLRAQSFGIL